MSKFTTEVRWICESKSGFTDEELKTKTVDQVIDAARTAIFDFSYPIYDNNHKPDLEKKILKHYYSREICAETVGLWKLWMNDKLNMIMPKYNKLYESEAAIYEKELYNIDVTTRDAGSDSRETVSDYTRTDALQHSNRTDDSSANRDRYSDTPQGGVANVENDSYLTSYRYTTLAGQTIVSESNTGTQRNAGSDTIEGEHDITTTEKGYRGSKTYSELLAEYSDKVLNIDEMIVNDLGDLFFGLWE